MAAAYFLIPSSAVRVMLPLYPFEYMAILCFIEKKENKRPIIHPNGIIPLANQKPLIKQIASDIISLPGNGSRTEIREY